jgi:hypothetical protein
MDHDIENDGKQAVANKPCTIEDNSQPGKRDF